MSSSCLFAALQYAQMGWHVLPIHSIDQTGQCTCKNPNCNAPGKHPITPHGLKDATTDPYQIDRWWQKWPFASVGIATGSVSGIVVLDIDPAHGGDDTLLDLESQNGKLPATVESLTGGGGRHIIFTHPGRVISNVQNSNLFGPGVDVRGDGGYIVAPPSKHKSGRLYEWEASSDPIQNPTVDLPQWVLKRFPAAGKQTATTPPGTNSNGKQGKKIKGGSRNQTLTSMAGAMRRQGMTQAAIEAGLLQVNQDQCVPLLTDAEVKKIAQSVGRYKPAGSTPTDDDLADEWIAQHPDTLYGLLEFRRYKDGVWAPVHERVIESEILDLAQNAKGDGYKPTAFKIKSITEIARMKLFRVNEQWNSDPNLLVCRNGTLQIDTRTLREHRKEDYLTSGVSYDYYPNADDTLWLDFLASTVPDASEFLQEFAGYAITTDTSYEIAVWLYGPRGSGKSTFIEGMRAMLGTRAGLVGLAQIENSRFALGDLPSKTLLFSTEQPSDYISTSYILNALISGELVTIERKYKDAETIVPHAKILWAMNDLPRIKDAGDGLFRRVKVVEFPKLNVTPNPLVKEEIKLMGAAILNWALIGLDRLKQRRYFQVPQSVLKSTQLFENTNDLAKMFFDDICEFGANFEVRGSTLYNYYRTWCEDNGHKPKSNTAFGLDDCRRLGLEKTRRMDGAWWSGVRIR